MECFIEIETIIYFGSFVIPSRLICLLKCVAETIKTLGRLEPAYVEFFQLEYNIEIMLE